METGSGRLCWLPTACSRARGQLSRFTALSKRRNDRCKTYPRGTIEHLLTPQGGPMRLVVLALIASLFAACSGGGGSAQPTATPAASANPTASAPSSAAARALAVPNVTVPVERPNIVLILTDDQDAA